MLPQAGAPRRREHSRAGRGRPRSGRLRQDRAPRSRGEPPCRDQDRDVCRRVARPRTVTEAAAIAGPPQDRWRELVRQRSSRETAAQVPGPAAEQTLRCRERAAARTGSRAAEAVPAVAYRHASPRAPGERLPRRPCHRRKPQSAAGSVPVQASTEPAAQNSTPPAQHQVPDSAQEPPAVPAPTSEGSSTWSAHRLRVDARAVRPEHSAHRANGPHRDDRAGRAQPRDRHGGPAPAASRQARRRASPLPGSWRRETSTPQVVRPDQPGPATGEEAAPPSW